ARVVVVDELARSGSGLRSLCFVAFVTSYICRGWAVRERFEARPEDPIVEYVAQRGRRLAGSRRPLDGAVDHTRGACDLARLAAVHLAHEAEEEEHDLRLDARPVLPRCSRIVLCDRVGGALVAP